MKDLFGNDIPEPTLYDFSVMNVELTKQYLADTYDKHNNKSQDMFMRTRITRRVFSILALHPDWDEDEVFKKVQDSFRKGGGTEIARKIDRELYEYFIKNWRDIIKLEIIEQGHEYDHYAGWSNVKLTKEQWVAKARAKWGDAYDYTDSVYIAGLKPITIRCIKHDYPFTVQAGNHIQINNKRMRHSGGCPICAKERLLESGRRLDEEGKKRKAEKKALQRARALERERKREQKRLEKERRKAEREAQIAANRAERERQKELARLQRIEWEQERIRKRQTDLISQAIEVHGNKYDYTHTTYEKKLYHGKMRWVLANVKCPVHGFFDARPEVHIKMRCNCAKCAGYPNELSAEERKQIWLEKCHARYGDRFSYRDVVYVNNDTPVKIFCKEHKYLFETTPDTHVRGAGGCPYCSASEGEVHIRKWLEDNNVDFDPQHQVSNENPDLDLQYLVPDFYLPDYNLYIEMNGQQHYEDVEHFHDRTSHRSKRKREWSFELQQLRDETFRKYCQDHNHNLLEIKYDQIERIPQILKRTLKKYAPK